MDKVEGLRNLVEIGATEVTKTAIRYESVRPKRLGIEAYALQKALEYGLAVPAVKSYGLNSKEQEYLILDKISGTNASETDIPLERVYELVGKQFAKIPLEYGTFGWIDPQSHEGSSSSWSNFMIQYITKYADRLRRRGEIDSNQTKRIISLVSQNVPNLKKSGLVHRDLKPLNIIVMNGVPFVLDWENVMLGDPLFDLGVLHSRFSNDERITKGFMYGLLGNACSTEQKRAITVYSLVNLVGSICFYNGKAPNSLFAQLDWTAEQLESPEVSILSDKNIRYPHPLPIYTRNEF